MMPKESRTLAHIRTSHRPLLRGLVLTVVGVSFGLIAGCSNATSSQSKGLAGTGGTEQGPRTLDAPIVEELRTGMEEGASSFDHSEFDALLSEHVDEAAGTVDYSGVRRDRSRLEDYLERLSNAELETLSRDAQLALLINAYNAYTLRLIVDHYPEIGSIEEISKPWSKKRASIGGYELSLDQLEHEIIRPLYRDPRIHFAVNCAAVSCPHLAESAFSGERIGEQLEARTRAILSNEKFVRVEGNTLRYSRVMKWYRFDFVDPSFTGSAENVARYIERYSREDVRNFIEEHDGSPETKALSYDWNLNDAN